MSDYDFTEYLDEEEIDPEILGDVLERDQRSRKELIDDSLYSEGTEIYFDMKALYSTLHMVNKNYALLLRKRDEFIERGVEYWLEKTRMDEFFREYLRLLHNYAASVHTLTHHTYTFFDRYEEEAPNLRSEYSDELRSRNLGVKVNLLKQIRHYTQKNWEPPLSATLSPAIGDDDEETLELYLDRDEMLDWDGWDADVQPFLEAFDEKIIITDLAKEYQEEVNDFYEWFQTLLLAKFYSELRDFMTANMLLDEERNNN